MAFENITMNLTALQDIDPYMFNATNIDFGTIVTGANSTTSNLVLLASLFIITFIMYLALSDKTAFQEFGYDDLRAFNIALASATLIGLNAISVEWSSNFFIVGFFGTTWLVTFIYIIIYENKE